MRCRTCASLRAVPFRESVVEMRDGPELLIGGEKVGDQMMKELMVEASVLRQSKLWKAATETVRAHALDLGIKQAKDFDQLLFAKAMVHVVGIMETVLSAVEKEGERRKIK